MASVPARLVSASLVARVEGITLIVLPAEGGRKLRCIVECMPQDRYIVDALAGASTLSADDPYQPRFDGYEYFTLPCVDNDIRATAAHYRDMLAMIHGIVPGPTIYSLGYGDASGITIEENGDSLQVMVTAERPMYAKIPAWLHSIEEAGLVLEIAPTPSRYSFWLTLTPEASSEKKRLDTYLRIATLM